MNALKKTIAHVAVPVPLRRIFDYQVSPSIDPTSLKTGARVLVPFGTRKLIGVLLSVDTQTLLSDVRLKSIIELIDTEPLISPAVFKLCQWAADYYHYPLGEVLIQTLPPALRKEKPYDKSIEANTSIQSVQQVRPEIQLTEGQHQAIETISQELHHFQSFLLNGVTGSGKTEVYLRLIEKIIAAGKQALVLVPEIGLTPQTIARFQQRFTVPVAVWHSNLNESERLQTWHLAKQGIAKIVIGTRSAVFMDCPDLGIIIIDEEHDLSFKQQDHFRYSARDLAVTRAKFENFPIVLGSATVSLESLYNTKTKKFNLLVLPERAGDAIHPHYHLVDIRNKPLEQGLSKVLLDRMRQHLEQDNQVLIFLNRRGYAPTLLCHYCGWMAKCPRCNINMTLHLTQARLHCHHCDAIQYVPKVCPQCQHEKLQHIGVGTERLEKTLIEQFPDVPVFRIDRDTTRRKYAMEKILAKVQEGRRQILVGTQMVAKGHHFPNVTLVGVVNADAGFFSADFRAVERTGQLLIQVAGRAGRAEKKGEVLIQTHYPDHPLLGHLTQYGYDSFAKLLLHERKDSEMPPYVHLALMHAESLHEERQNEFLMAIKALAEKVAIDSVMILGPIPSPMPKRKNYFRSQLLFQSSHRASLQRFLTQLMLKVEALNEIKAVKWTLDIDPLEMF